MIVQATGHGATTAPWSMRSNTPATRPEGWATVKRTISDAELRDMHAPLACAVCALTSSNASGGLHAQDELMEIASRIAPLGWVVVYFEAVDLPELWDFFHSLAHHGGGRSHGPGLMRQPVDGPEFQLFLVHARTRQRGAR